MLTRARIIVLLCIASICTVNFLANQPDLKLTTTHTWEREAEAGQGDDADAGYYRGEYVKYVPGIAEELVLQQSDTLGFDSPNNPATCFIWQQNTNLTPPAFQANFAGYMDGLENQAAAIKNFKAIPSLVASMKRSGGDLGICETTRIHPDGVAGLFPPDQLSLSSSGYVEPLLPPMRHPKVCNDRSHLLSVEYLVHDFEAMCRKLKPHSKLVFVDMGAALNFRTGGKAGLALMEIYEKLGFVFDHIYGFELKFTEPETVYGSLVPERHMHSYHWINVGVSPEEGNKLNPLHSIIKKFDEDDFIVVKLDIDTSSIELSLAQQLLDDDIYSKLIDHFYFEHHVHLGELKFQWLATMQGTIKDSLVLFSKLREKGIPAHFWV